MSTLYEHRDEPDRWIVEHNGEWFRVPAAGKGWAGRQLLSGRPKGERLRTVASYFRLGLGLPEPDENPRVEQLNG